MKNKKDDKKKEFKKPDIKSVKVGSKFMNHVQAANGQNYSCSTSGSLHGCTGGCN